MNKYFSGIVLLIVLAFSACAQKNINGAKTISYMRYERTACFGRCPAYMVEVYKNGTIRYTGRQFTEYTGVYERNIGTKKAQSILKKYATTRVDTCKEMYENNIPDMPGLMYVFTIGGKNKEILNAGFGPRFLETFAGEVDQIAKPGIGWKKIKDIKPTE
jgi:hypothetical protein